MNKRQLADAFIDYVNTLSNVFECGDNIMKLLDKDELIGLSGEQIWNLSSKKLSLNQFKSDIGIAKLIKVSVNVN